MWLRAQADEGNDEKDSSYKWKLNYPYHKLIKPQEIIIMYQK